MRSTEAVQWTAEVAHILAYSLYGHENGLVIGLLRRAVHPTIGETVVTEFG